MTPAVAPPRPRQKIGRIVPWISDRYIIDTDVKAFFGIADSLMRRIERFFLHGRVPARQGRVRDPLFQSSIGKPWLIETPLGIFGGRPADD